MRVTFGAVAAAGAAVAWRLLSGPRLDRDQAAETDTGVASRA